MFTDGAVSSDVYLNLLSDEFISSLVGYGIPINRNWLQQNGAISHTSSPILCFMTFWNKEFSIIDICVI
jgi:hypothetical protein